MRAEILVRGQSGPPVTAALLPFPVPQLSCAPHLHPHDVKLSTWAGACCLAKCPGTPKPALKLSPENLLHPWPSGWASAQAPTEPLLHQAGVNRFP